MKRLSRRAALAGTVALAGAGAARAEEPLKLVLGFPPGASSDTLTRLIADKMRVSLGRTVVVENKPGAVGIVANLAVKSAPPDGNTLLMTPLAPMVAFPHSYSKLDYDPFKDYVPVAELCAFYLAMGVGSAVPAKTLAEYAALVKTGGDLRQLRLGRGRQPAALLRPDVRQGRRRAAHPRALQGHRQRHAGDDVGRDPGCRAHRRRLGHAAAVGQGPHARGLEPPAARRSIPTCRPSRKAATTSKARPGTALFAPAGTPQPIVDKLAAAAVEAVRQPDVRQKLEPLGLNVTGLGPAEMAKILRADYDKWGPVIRASGFKAD